MSNPLYALKSALFTAQTNFHTHRSVHGPISSSSSSSATPTNTNTNAVKQNKGINIRAWKDTLHIASTAPDQIEQKRIQALKRKAQVYEQLQKSTTTTTITTAVVNTKGENAILVDFHKKRKEEKKVKEDLVEVIDELGRNRWVPREEAQSSEDEEELEKERMKYEPKPEEPVKDIAGIHFDPTEDNRQYGASFFNFSQDEAERKKQQDALKERRSETLDVQAVKLSEEEVRQQKIADRLAKAKLKRNKRDAAAFLSSIEQPKAITPEEKVMESSAITRDTRSTETNPPSFPSKSTSF